MKAAVAGSTALLLLVGFSSTAQAQKMKLGEVLVFYVPDLKPDVDAAAFETHVLTQVALAWKKRAPDSVLSLVRKDRGPRPT